MISALITLLVYLIILGILWWLVDYIIATIPIPDPPARLIRIVLVVIFCLIVIALLLQLLGVGGDFGLPRIGS